MEESKEQKREISDEHTLGSGTADAYAVETAGSREEEARVDCNHCMVPVIDLTTKLKFITNRNPSLLE